MSPADRNETRLSNIIKVSLTLLVGPVPGFSEVQMTETKRSFVVTALIQA